MSVAIEQVNILQRQTVVVEVSILYYSRNTYVFLIIVTCIYIYTIDIITMVMNNRIWGDNLAYKKLQQTTRAERAEEDIITNMNMSVSLSNLCISNLMFLSNLW